jgi:hypothetical protein
MPTHTPIGSCCSRPKFNAVSGNATAPAPLVDFIKWRTWTGESRKANDDALADRASKIARVVHWFGSTLLRRGSP